MARISSVRAVGLATGLGHVAGARSSRARRAELRNVLSKMVWGAGGCSACREGWEELHHAAVARNQQLCWVQIPVVILAQEL